MGQWLQEQQFAPGLILSSPAQRAKQTAAAVAEAMGLDAEQIQFDKDLYLAGRATLLNILRKIPDTMDSVLLVAHNPGLDDLVDWLAPEPPPLSDSGKLMTTAAIAMFELPAGWANLRRGGGILQQLLRPPKLP